MKIIIIDTQYDFCFDGGGPGGGDHLLAIKRMADFLARNTDRIDPAVDLPCVPAASSDIFPSVDQLSPPAKHCSEDGR